ncbi:CLCA_X family protein [Ferrimonas pelagia]
MTEKTSTGLRRAYYRRGPDYRHGEDVSFGEIKAQFGFGAITIGAWVQKQEKVIAANLVFDALADLAFLLNVPPSLLGLRGQLDLAFGTGGQPGAQAHYAPGSRTLALAKNAGAGALAHEWWHSFDHYIAAKLYPAHVGDKGLMAMASSQFLQPRQPKPHPLNQRLEAVFAAVLLTPEGDDRHDYVRRSVALDRRLASQLGRRYYSLPTEMMARAFEAAIQSDERIKNVYLVSGTKQSELAQAGAFPDAEHLQRIRTALLAYFEPLGWVMSQKGSRKL